MSYAVRTACLVAATALTTAVFATLSSCAQAAPRLADTPYLSNTPAQNLKLSERVHVMPPLDAAPVAPVVPHEPEDNLPEFHPERWCRRLRGLSPQDMYAPSAQDVAVCMRAEQYAYDNLHDLWPLLSARGKVQCTTGLGGSTPTDNYGLLEACALGQLRKEENERNANGNEPRFERW